jgi:hypothetical protein
MKNPPHSIEAKWDGIEEEDDFADVAQQGEQALEGGNEERNHKLDGQPPRAGCESTGPMGDRAKREDCCVICHQEEFEAQVNEIVYCDRCDLGFHQQCYGLPKVPEGDFFCEFCGVVKEASDRKKKEPAPLCELCHQRGGGLVKVWMVDPDVDEDLDEGEERDEWDESDEEGEEEEDDDDAMKQCADADAAAAALRASPSSLSCPSALPAFVHKVCALAGWNRRPRRLVRFVAGTNAQVAVLSRGLVAKYRCARAKEEAAAAQWQAADAATCGICHSSVGLLVRCRHHDPESDFFKCSFYAHAACAFNAGQASLLLHDVRQSPLVQVWCPAHRPEPSVERPGGEAVARCLGLLLHPSPAAVEQQQQQQQQEQSRRQPLLQHLLHERKKESYGRLGGYQDDKFNLLRQRLASGAEGARLILCSTDRAKEIYACHEPTPPATPLQRQTLPRREKTMEE